MAQLADILVTLTLDNSKFKQKLDEAGKSMSAFRHRMKEVTSTMNGGFNKDLSEVAKNFQIIGQASKTTTQKVVQANNESAESMEKVELSARHLARTLTTDLGDSFRVLVAGTKEFRNFGGSGARASLAVKEKFAYLPSYLQNYVQRLEDAGRATDAFARLNERYGKVVALNMVKANDHIISKTTQSVQIMDTLRSMNIQPLSQQFLKLGNRLEENAKKGTALNLAITQLGHNAGAKALQDRIKMINKGLGRMRANLMVTGIATGLAVWGLVEMSNVVDGRLIPAFDTLKSTWLDALTPFVNAFTTFVVWVMKGATAVGELMKSFAEAHPQLSQMFWGFMLLTLAISAILSPLAVGIGLTGGLAASFTVLWKIIAPFVLGFLTVAGVAVLVAGAIVTVTAVINNLWKASEAFREAWIGVWDGVKNAFVTGFATPVKSAWEDLKEAFMALVTTFTGGEAQSIGEFWKWLGDIIAIMVTNVAGAVLPVLQGAFTVLGTVVTTVIDGIIMALNWLNQMWKKHGDDITAVLLIIWSAIQTAFGAVSSYLVSIMPQLTSIITSTFNAIKAVIDFTMKYIAPVVVTAFKYIWQVIKMVMPLVLAIVKSIWNNIKAVITSAINIITNVIDLFTNVLQGNWKGAWENVKAIVTNAVKLVWNLIQLYFLGKLLAPLKGFASQGLSIIKGAWNAVKSITTALLNALKAFIVGVWKAILSALKGSFTGILNAAKTTFSTLKSSVSTIFNTIKSTAVRTWNGIKNAIINPIKTAKETVLGIVDQIKGAFNNMKLKFPKISLPKLSIGSTSKTIMGKEFTVPKFGISWNAKGNIFNGPSILGGNQGVGEAGAEVVMPIQHKRYMKPFASAVASHLGKHDSGGQGNGGSKYEIIFNEPVIIREDADIQRIVDELERRKKIEQRSKGFFAYSS